MSVHKNLSSMTPKTIPKGVKQDLSSQSLHLAYHCIMFKPTLSQLAILGLNNNHSTPSLVHHQWSLTDFHFYTSAKCFYVKCVYFDALQLKMHVENIIHLAHWHPHSSRNHVRRHFYFRHMLTSSHTHNFISLIRFEIEYTKGQLTLITMQCMCFANRTQNKVQIFIRFMGASLCLTLLHNGNAWPTTSPPKSNSEGNKNMINGNKPNNFCENHSSGPEVETRLGCHYLVFFWGYVSLKILYVFEGVGIFGYIFSLV